MIENLYILGAGASVDAGAPMMTNFIDIAEDFVISNKYKDINEKKELFEIIKSLNSLHAKSKIDLNNIESVLGLLEMSELLEIPNRNRELEFKSLKTSYIRLIAETIELSMRFNINGPNRISTNGSYPRFAQFFNTKKDNSAIISFNYDMGIDVALHNEGIKYNYYLDESDSGFPLLKLHGSLNWFEDENKKIVPHYLSTYFQKMNYKTFGNESRTGLLQFDEYLKLNFKDKHPNKVPFIIPPTWNKTMYHKNVSNIWKQASKCLSEAKNIYVIGYSLPETDSFFKFLFSLGTNSTTRIRKFWVINPDTTGTKDRFQNLLGPQMLERFKYLQMNFDDALNSIQ